MPSKEAAKAARPQVRRALYYPYMQPRDPEWVKAALLAFGQINRIVPNGYPLQDIPDVAFLATQKTATGQLIRNITPDWDDIEVAQRRLASRLQGANMEQLRSRFGKERTTEDLGGQEGFQIHEHKIHDALIHLLESASLAWAPASPSKGAGKWRSVHPHLGEAIMSMTSIAAARRKSLDLVTENTEMHAALASLDEGLVLDALLGVHASPPSATGTLGHIILTMNLDLTRLRNEDMAEIVENSTDFQRFRQELVGLATAVPNDAQPEEHDRALRKMAEEVVSRWADSQRSWHHRLRSAFGDAARSDFEAKARKAAESTLAAAASGGLAAALGTVGSASVETLAVGAGISIAIGAVSSVAGRGSASSDEPVRYLIRVHDGATSIVASPKRLRPHPSAAS